MQLPSNFDSLVFHGGQLGHLNSWFVYHADGWTIYLPPDTTGLGSQQLTGQDFIGKLGFLTRADSFHTSRRVTRADCRTIE